MNKIKEYAIFPGQIKINNCTYFGLDYDLTDFVNNLAEQNKKYKEVIDKVSTRLEYFLIGNSKYQSSQEEFIKLLDILKEADKEVE